MAPVGTMGCFWPRDSSFRAVGEGIILLGGL